MEHRRAAGVTHCLLQYIRKSFQDMLRSFERVVLNKMFLRWYGAVSERRVPA